MLKVSELLDLYSDIGFENNPFTVWFYDVEKEKNYLDSFPVPKKLLKYEVVKFVAVSKNVINVYIREAKPRQLSIFDIL